MATCGDWIDWLMGRSITHNQLLAEKNMLVISIEEEKSKVKSLQTDVTNMYRIQTNYKAEVDTLKDLLKEKKIELERCHEDHEALEERHRSTEQILSDNLLTLTSAQKELEQMKLSKGKLDHTNDTLDRSLTEKELKFSTLVEEHQTLKNKYETLEKRHKMMESVICEKEMTAGCYEEKNEQLEMSLKLLQEEKAKQELAFNSLQEKNKQMETELTSTQEQKAKQKLAFNSLQEKNKQMELELTSTQDEIAQLSSSLLKFEQSKQEVSISDATKDQVKSTAECVADNMVENPAEIA